jgi:hypothetical protein
VPRSAESFDARAQKARVVEWQTRTFEGRMPKGMRVQVPPRALFGSHKVARCDRANMPSAGRDSALRCPDAAARRRYR